MLVRERSFLGLTKKNRSENVDLSNVKAWESFALSPRILSFLCLDFFRGVNQVLRNCYRKIIYLKSDKLIFLYF